MAKLWLEQNLFSGIVDLTLLPSGMKVLNLSGNRLSGEVFIAPALFDIVTIDNTQLTKRVLGDDSKHVPRCWETSLMDQFFASISKEGKIEISRGQPWREYCEWNGVACDFGVFKSIEYNYAEFGNFNVHSLAPTVEKIEIEHSQQKYALQTRVFPRELQFCSLIFNQLFGSVDLLTLPTNLRFIDLSENELTGPISLTSLPCNLEHLRLYSNRIVQSVVYYDLLPPKVEEIVLVKKAEGTNQIGRVCAVYAEMVVKNKKIFKHMRRKQVR